MMKSMFLAMVTAVVLAVGMPAARAAEPDANAWPSANDTSLVDEHGTTAPEAENPSYFPYRPFYPHRFYPRDPYYRPYPFYRPYPYYPRPYYPRPYYPRPYYPSYPYSPYSYPY